MTSFFFSPSLTWNDDGLQQLFGMNLTANVSKLAAVRLGYERSGPVRLETQFHFHRNAKFGYGVNFPSGEIAAASNGTHALAYEHVLGREPEIGAPLLVLSTNRMNITVERHKRIAEDGVPLKTLSALPGLSAEYVDPSEQLGNLVVVPLVGIAEQVSQQHVREFYDELSQSAAFLLQEHPQSQVAIRVANGESDAGRAFEKMLRQEINGSKARVLLGYHKPQGAVSLEGFRSGKTAIAEHAPKLSHEKVVIDIIVSTQHRHVKEWQLDILAPSGIPVKSFRGTNTLPISLEWNWHNEAGQLAPAGQYRCALNMKSKAGKKYSTGANVEVTLTRREVTLRFTKKPNTAVQQSARTEAGIR